ncbi:hypothetical protein SAMN05421854_109226 [Amycolatopsis rubida]|uniref:Uncharacterized protein n=1 Tax=Amycolatopsis rubida TaxID=112413 RepID=A0A1I5WHC4_9PSEU|nr:hypothetical protein SAMN05421854_109226 [Amycolatopsis rubida]
MRHLVEPLQGGVSAVLLDIFLEQSEALTDTRSGRRFGARPVALEFFEYYRWNQ